MDFFKPQENSSQTGLTSCAYILRRLTFWFLNRNSFFAEKLQHVEGSPTCRVVRRGVAPRRSRVQLGPAVQQHLDHFHVVVVLYNNEDIKDFT